MFPHTYLIMWMNLFGDWDSSAYALEDSSQRQGSALVRANTVVRPEFEFQLSRAPSVTVDQSLYLCEPQFPHG